MTEPSRQFDVSWLEETGVLKTQEQPERVEDAPLLQGFRVHPEDSLRVVEIASAAGVVFEEALHGVLRLVSRDYLEIVERDPSVAGDHLVRLTPFGRQTLDSS